MSTRLFRTLKGSQDRTSEWTMHCVAGRGAVTLRGSRVRVGASDPGCLLVPRAPHGPRAQIKAAAQPVIRGGETTHVSELRQRELPGRTPPQTTSHPGSRQGAALRHPGSAHHPEVTLPTLPKPEDAFYDLS